MIVWGIDPGEITSGIVHVEVCAGAYRVLESEAKLPNESLAQRLRVIRKSRDRPSGIILETMTSYGARLGSSTMTTLMWAGRFIEAYHPNHVELMSRHDVKTVLCGKAARVSDADVWDAVIRTTNLERKEAVGTKKDQGPLYGVKSHARAALALVLARGIDVGWIARVSTGATLPTPVEAEPDTA